MKDSIITDVCLAVGFFTLGFAVDEFFIHKNNRKERVDISKEESEIKESSPLSYGLKKQQVDYRKLAHDYISSGKKAEKDREEREVPLAERQHPEDDPPLKDGEEEIVVYKIDPDRDNDKDYPTETVLWSLPDAQLFGDGGELVERPELIIGDVVLTYEDYPSVYLRNEYLKTDFEVLVSLDSYEGGQWND